MKTHRIPLNASTFGAEEIEAAIEVLRSGRVTMGERCTQFETTFADYLGGGEAVFVNSGSSANLLIFFALANYAVPRPEGKRNWFPGCEVIVPAVTWSTTLWPIVQAGGIPVLVDSDPCTLQMEPAAMRAALSDKTVAVCAVHVLGNTVNMDEVRDFAGSHGLWVIEDTCEALGSRFRGNLAGTFGDLASFSFYFSHHITTVEGGMIVTRNAEMAELLRCLRAHGWTRDLRQRAQLEKRYADIDPGYLFVNTGFNVRPTEINAAFGLVQLGKLPRFNQRRKQIASYWDQSLRPLAVEGVLHSIRATENADVAWFGYPVVCRDRRVRDELREILTANGIENRPIICGNMARQPAMAHVKHRISGELTGSDRVMDCGLLWGSHPAMVQEDLDYVAEVVLGSMAKE